MIYWRFELQCINSKGTWFSPMAGSLSGVTSPEARQQGSNHERHQNAGEATEGTKLLTRNKHSDWQNECWRCFRGLWGALYLELNLSAGLQDGFVMDHSQPKARNVPCLPWLSSCDDNHTFHCVCHNTHLPFWIKPAISCLVNEHKGLSMCRTGGASLLLQERGWHGGLLKIFQELV